MNVLDRIIALRLERGWSEYRLSQEADIPQSTISSWYSKHSVPTIENLEKLCGAYGITLSQFFLEDNSDNVVTTITPLQARLLDCSSHLSEKQLETFVAFLETM